jgi:hypothetical protein
MKLALKNYIAVVGFNDMYIHNAFLCSLQNRISIILCSTTQFYCPFCKVSAGYYARKQHNRWLLDKHGKRQNS